MCSLEQLLPLKGLRTELIKMTKQRRNSPRVTKPSVKKVEKKDALYVSPRQSKIRELPIDYVDDASGAARTEALVNGSAVVNAIIDPGSYSTFISKKLARELNLDITPLGDDASGNRMADGSSSRPIREVSGVLIQVQGVLIRVMVLVFQNPPYHLLLGTDSIKLLGISADYRKSHFCIASDQGIEPLTVEFNTSTFRLNKVQLEDFSDEESYDSEDSDYNASEDDVSTDENSSGYESYLILPCFEEEVKPKESFLNENVSGINQDLYQAASNHSMEPTSDEEKLKAIKQQIEEAEVGDDEKQLLLDLFSNYLDVIGLDYNDLKQTNLVKFHVDTGDNPPIMKRPNRYMSHAELETFKKELSKMLATGQVIPTMHVPKKDGTSSLGWAFPAMYVGKKQTVEGRLVVQFQDLNSVTKDDPWPLPSLQHLMEEYLGANIFTTLDLLKGFNQILVDEDSIPKLTMATPWGCFSYRVMPFGVKNGPACFSRAIYLAMQEFLGVCVTTYIDDATVYSRSFEEHLVHLEKVLQRFREVNMVIKPSKANIAKKEVSILGFVVSKNGIKPHPNLVKKILEFPVPKNKTDVRAFTSLAGFYRRHVNQFGDIVAPLNEVLKKSVKFEWGTRQEEAFSNAKHSIVNAVQLKYPDPQEKYKLYTDASELGIGAVLVQYDPEFEEDRPVCFLSRKFTATEMNYPTVEKELLAVIYAFSKLRRYILDKEFDLFTDSIAVKYLFTKSSPGSRLQRWIVTAQEYRYKIYHLPGKQNVVADVLSRYPPTALDVEDFESPDEIILNTWLIDPNFEEDYEPHILKIYQTLIDASENQNMDSNIKSINLRFRLNEESELFRKIGERYVKVPKIRDRLDIIKETHDGHGHFGQEATWKRLYFSYWWPYAYEDIKNYVSSCEECQLFAYLPEKVPEIGQIPVLRLFERFAIDYVGPFPESKLKNKYIIMAVEYYTGWPVARAVRSADSDTTVKFLYEDVFTVFGPPMKLLSDNGLHFTSKEVEEFVKFVNVRHQFAAPYKPSTNGKVEKLNGTIVRGIKKMVINNPKGWDDLLPSMLYAYRTKIHKVLGISPYEALYGVSPRNHNADPLQELGMKLGLERLYLLMDKNLSYEEEKLSKAYKNTFKNVIPIGSQVILVKILKKNKLDTTYKNKVYTVIGQFHNNTYILINDKGVKLKRAVNGKNLKIFKKRNGVPLKYFKE